MLIKYSPTEFSMSISLKIRRVLNQFYLILFFIFSVALNGQEQDLSKSTDLGINITSVLSSFSGNGSFLEASDFPISLRLKRKNRILRLGLGLTGTQEEFFDDVTFAFRNSLDRAAFLRIGFERHVPIDEKWSFFWGLDAIGSYELNRVTIENASTSRIENTKLGIGGGPLAGIKYNITDRLYLSTESTLYFINKFINQKESGVTFLDINTTSQEFSLQPPLFLYLNYAF